jgi:hypothetical protein
MIYPFNPYVFRCNILTGKVNLKSAFKSVSYRPQNKQNIDYNINLRDGIEDSSIAYSKNQLK